MIQPSSMEVGLPSSREAFDKAMIQAKRIHLSLTREYKRKAVHELLSTLLIAIGATGGCNGK